MARLDLSDQEIVNAINSVRDVNGTTEWAIFTHTGQTNKIRVFETGDCSFDEMCDSLSDGKAMYVFARWRINGVLRFCYLNWLGEGVQGMLKGAFANYAINFGNFISINGGFHVQVNARNEGDLDEEDIKKKLTKAIGASYDEGGRGRIQGQQGKGTPDPQPRKPANKPIIDKSESDKYWDEQNSKAQREKEERAKAEADRKANQTGSSQGAGNLKGRFEQLARDQAQPSNPEAYRKPVTVERSAEPAPAADYGAGYEQGGYEDAGYDQAADQGYDQGGYEDAGYDQAADQGYDQGGYDEQAGYDQAADDQGGYDQGGYDQGGYDQGGYDQGGYDQGGYDQGGYDQSADQGGYDQGGYDQGGYDEQAGYDQGGYDQPASGTQCKALYPYGGEAEGDLIFNTGDIINVVDDTDPSGWWEGELNGQRGFFPSNFVEAL